MLRDTLDYILTLAFSLHKNSPMAFSAYSLFILFPRMCLRPLPNGCKGRFADGVLRKRCSLFMKGDASRLITDSHEA